MRFPPADLNYLRGEYLELAGRLRDLWESSILAEQGADSPQMLSDTMTQLVDLLGICDPGRGTARLPVEISTLGEYGLHLIDELTCMARELSQPEIANRAERLSLPFALWVGRNDGEIRNLMPVVNALAQFANDTSDPRSMAILYSHCCELIEAASPACEQAETANSPNPWRLLLLHRAVIATRSLNAELMAPAFDAIVECVPEEAQRFFAEGMEQMAITDHPDCVREIMQRYYIANTAPRRLH